MSDKRPLTKQHLEQIAKDTFFYGGHEFEIRNLSLQTAINYQKDVQSLGYKSFLSGPSQDRDSNGETLKYTLVVLNNGGN